MRTCFVRIWKIKDIVIRVHRAMHPTFELASMPDSRRQTKQAYVKLYLTPSNKVIRTFLVSW